MKERKRERDISGKWRGLGGPQRSSRPLEGAVVLKMKRGERERVMEGREGEGEKGEDGKERTNE